MVSPVRAAPTTGAGRPYRPGYPSRRHTTPAGLPAARPGSTLRFPRRSQVIRGPGGCWVTGAAPRVLCCQPRGAVNRGWRVAVPGQPRQDKGRPGHGRSRRPAPRASDGNDRPRWSRPGWTTKQRRPAGSNGQRGRSPRTRQPRQRQRRPTATTDGDVQTGLDDEAATRVVRGAGQRGRSAPDPPTPPAKGDDRRHWSRPVWTTRRRRGLVRGPVGAVGCVGPAESRSGGLHSDGKCFSFLLGPGCPILLVR